jgi:hypothetical protein
VNCPMPETAVLWKAIDVYLGLAYDAPPKTVRAKLDVLRALSEADVYNNPAFERDPKIIPPTKLALRLGNRQYPHMKMVIEIAPDGQSALFRADTHDAHVKAGSAEAEAFRQLTAANATLAAAIESAWASQSVPTFKQYLQNDLAKRQAAANVVPSPGTPGEG